MKLAPVLDRVRILPKRNFVLERNFGSIGEIFYDDVTNSLRLYSGKDLGGSTIITTKNFVSEIKNTNIATVYYNVTVGPGLGGQTGNKYYIDAEYRPVLNLVIGYTYVFDQSDPTNQYYPNANGTLDNPHPLNFSADNANGELNGGTSYLLDVLYFLDDNEVTQQEYIEKFTETANRKVQLTVGSTTPAILYYWCYLHSEMGSSILPNLPGTGSGGGASVDVSEIPPQVAIEGNIWFNKNNGKLYVYIVDGDSSQWVQPSVSAGIGGGASVEVSDTAPASPTEGTIWYNSSNANLYIYVSDDDSEQWIQPAVPIPTVNTFKTINFNDSTQFTAEGNDTITFIDGPGIEITSDPVNKSLTISSNVSNAFSQINFNDSTQFTAEGNDTITFIDGPGIEITSDPVNKSLTFNSTITSSLPTQSWSAYEDDFGNLFFTNNGTPVLKIEPSGALTSVNVDPPLSPIVANIIFD